MVSKRYGAASVLLLAFTLSACGNYNDLNDSYSVVDVLAEDANANLGVSTFESLAKTTDLWDTLDTATNVGTLFIPSDKAFKTMPAAELEALKKDSAARLKYLQGYIVPQQRYTEGALFKAAPTFLSMQNGATVPLTVGNTAPTVDNPTSRLEVLLNGNVPLRSSDLASDNAAIFVVDELLDPAESTFSATLSGDDEVPAVATDGSGKATASLEGTKLTIAGSYKNLVLSGETAVNIHGPAAAGKNAVSLLSIPYDNKSGTFRRTIDLAAAENSAFGPALYGYLQGELVYLNIVTPLNPDGEIRGQLKKTEAAAPPTPTPPANGGGDTPADGGTNDNQGADSGSAP